MIARSNGAVIPSKPGCHMQAERRLNSEDAAAQ
jgi:hypothetical protein